MKTHTRSGGRTLPAYSVSKPLSRQFRLVTLLAVVAVLVVHGYNLGSRFGGGGENAAVVAGSPGIVGFIEYLVSQMLCRFPSATLFAISGFLLFRDLEPHWANYAAKFKRRLRTVVIPFLLWSALGLGLYVVLQALPGTEGYFSKDFLAASHPWEFLVHLYTKLLVKPVAYPLWFLQTLIVCIALAPLLYWPARILRWFAVLPFAVLWVTGVPASNWNDFKGLTFFVLGVVIALELRRGATLTPPRWLRVWLPPLWVLGCVLFTILLRDVETSWAHVLHKVFIILAVASVWLGHDVYLVGLGKYRLTKLLLPFTFFIFAGQEPLLTIVKRIGMKAVGSGDAALLALYVLAPAFTLALVVSAAALLRRYVPRPYAWLTGGR